MDCCTAASSDLRLEVDASGDAVDRLRLGGRHVDVRPERVVPCVVHTDCIVPGPGSPNRTTAWDRVCTMRNVNRGGGLSGSARSLQFGDCWSCFAAAAGGAASAAGKGHARKMTAAKNCGFSLPVAYCVGAAATVRRKLRPKERAELQPRSRGVVPWYQSGRCLVRRSRRASRCL